MNNETLTLSLDAIAAFMLLLQKAVFEDTDITPLMEQMQFVPDENGKLFVLNMEDFGLDISKMLENVGGGDADQPAFDFLEE